MTSGELTIFAILKKLIKNGGTSPSDIQAAVDSYLSEQGITVNKVDVGELPNTSGYIYFKRGVYSDFDVDNMKVGEIVFITGGDPNTLTGKSVYACFGNGDTERLLTYDDYKDDITSIQTDLTSKINSLTTIMTELVTKISVVEKDQHNLSASVTQLDADLTEAENKIDILNGTAEGSVHKTVTNEIAKIVAEAPEDFDTLKKMSDWISNHEDSAADMNSRIQTNTYNIATIDVKVESFLVLSSNNADDIADLNKNKADKSDIPTSLPANGGNADTVGMYGLSNGSGGKGVAYIPADGAPLEIGRYIDMHATEGVDYTARIEVDTSGTISIYTVDDGKIVLSGLNANLTGSVGGHTPEQLIQSNPNLFVNPDFKINRSGQTTFESYLTGGSLIIADSWYYMSGANDTIFSRNDDGSIHMEQANTIDSGRKWSYIVQIPKHLKTGDTVTLSVKMRGSGAVSMCQANTPNYNNVVLASEYIIYKYTFTVEDNPNIIDDFGTGIGVCTESDGVYVDILWMKIEYGTVATPFIPSNFMVEALKCRPLDNSNNHVLFSNGNWGTVSNPNLLDNPDFKINQRGKKEYTSSSAGQTHTADRWALSGINGLSANIGTDMVTLIGTSDTYPHWRQRTENPTMFAGKIVTLSCEWSSNGTDVLRIALADNDSGFSNWKYETFEGGGIASMTVPILNGIYCVSLIDMGLDGKGINIEWVKLEIGSVATPFVPPDPATELLKCQRYFEKGLASLCTARSSENVDWLTDFYFRTAKRVAPSITVTNFRNNTTPMNFDFVTTCTKDIMTLHTTDGTRFEVGNFLYNYEYEASAEL